MLVTPQERFLSMPNLPPCRGRGLWPGRGSEAFAIKETAARCSIVILFHDPSAITLPRNSTRQESEGE
jgi:hypothetical protein